MVYCVYVCMYMRREYVCVCVCVPRMDTMHTYVHTCFRLKNTCGYKLSEFQQLLGTSNMKNIYRISKGYLLVVN